MANNPNSFRIALAFSLFALAVAVAPSCNEVVPVANPPGADPMSDPATTERDTVTFTESSATLVNPERGYYVGIDLVSGGSATSIRENNGT